MKITRWMKLTWISWFSIEGCKMIAIGNTESKVHGLFVGDTKIVSAYLGDQKVFPDNA